MHMCANICRYIGVRMRVHVCVCALRFLFLSALMIPDVARAGFLHDIGGARVCRLHRCAAICM